VENRHLWILETRTAKRTPQAAVRAAVDMVKEKLITEREALLRIEPNQMDFFLHPTIDTHQSKLLILMSCLISRSCINISSRV